MDKKFSTTIKQKYWDMKMQDVVRVGHFWEYKSDVLFWNKRIHGLKLPCEGVFLIGSRPEFVQIVEIDHAFTWHIPEKYAEAITTDVCWVLKCIPMTDAPSNGSLYGFARAESDSMEVRSRQGGVVGEVSLGRAKAGAYETDVV